MPRSQQHGGCSIGECRPDKHGRLQIVERSGWVELVWHIALGAGASRISKSDRYLLSGAVVEGPRRDGRPGILRSQLTLTPEGHVHIRCCHVKLAGCFNARACICAVLAAVTARMAKPVTRRCLHIRCCHVKLAHRSTASVCNCKRVHVCCTCSSGSLYGKPAIRSCLHILAVTKQCCSLIRPILPSASQPATLSSI